MSEVAHANSLRGAEFKKLLGKPLTWIIIVLSSLLAGVVGAMIQPGLALIGFVGVFLIGIGIVFWIADHRAAQAFYDAYANARGLTRHSKGTLGGLTPLLRKGDKQRVNEMFEGELAPGLEGQLVLWTYVVESTDSKGNRTETNYPFTLAVFHLPEVTPNLKELRVQRKSGFKALEKFEDAFRRSHERVTLESEAMRDRYEIFKGKGEDPVWVRRLFSPSFIVWLSETPPNKFAFEIENGWLCTYVPKHWTSTETLDEIVSVGAFVANRFREEVSQTSPKAARELG